MRPESRRRYALAAAAVYYFSGISFGLSNIAVMVYVATHERVPIVFGVDLDGGGPFERFGYRWMTALMALFVGVCILEVVAGRWLSQYRRLARPLSALLLPLGAIFWFGFALPLPWLLGIVKAALLAISWPSLRL